MLDRLRWAGFDILTLHHAEAIMIGGFPGAAVEIEEALLALSLPVPEIVGSGGGETRRAGAYFSGRNSKEKSRTAGRR